MESMNSPEVAQKLPELHKLPRRDILKGGLLAAATAGAALLGLKVGRILAPGENTSSLKTPELTLSEQHKELFNRLFTGIDAVAGSDEDREIARKEAVELSKIIEINDQFVSLYKNDVDDQGEPKLLSLYRKKYSFFDTDPESMIFILNNDKKAKALILNPISKYIEGEQGEGVFDLISNIKAKVDVDENSKKGEREYLLETNVKLAEYAFVDTQRGGTIEVAPEGDLREEARIIFEADKKSIEEALSNPDLPKVGNIRVRAHSKKYGNYNIPQGEGGDFKGGDLFSEINIDPISRFFLYHEMGHQLDILDNSNQLFKYFSLQTIYDLMLLREEALGSDEWGRSFPSIRKIFSRKRTAYKPGSKLSMIDEGKLEDLRRQNDNYPDWIFCSGYYTNGYILNHKIFRQEDWNVIGEYRRIFQQEEGKSSSLEDFIKGRNSPVLAAMRGKSPWLDAVFTKLENILPDINDKIYWLPKPSASPQNPGEITNYKVPNGEASDADYYDFCLEIGQRLAVIEMFANNDPALDILTPEEKTEFQKNLLITFSASDQEMFGNMIGISLNYDIESSPPNPYSDYLKRIKRELDTRAVRVVPSQELTAAISRLNKACPQDA